MSHISLCCNETNCYKYETIFSNKLWFFFTKFDKSGQIILTLNLSTKQVKQIHDFQLIQISLVFEEHKLVKLSPDCHFSPWTDWTPWQYDIFIIIIILYYIFVVSFYATNNTHNIYKVAVFGCLFGCLSRFLAHGP